MATYQVRIDADGQKILSDPLTGLSSTLATSELPGAVQPDGVTTKVDSAGVLSALGGNLLMNDEIWITESGTFIVPVTGWYEVWMIGGGWGAYAVSNSSWKTVNGGNSGHIKTALVYYTSGEQVSVTIGAGGQGAINGVGNTHGGETSFGAITTEGAFGFTSAAGYLVPASSSSETAYGHGAGVGGSDLASNNFDGKYYGAGGAGMSGSTAGPVGNGAQGAIRLRFWNPAKANGLSE